MATTLTKADKEFFEQHADIGQTLKQGWAHGLTREVKDGFEAIYQRTIDPDFHLQRNCTQCMVDMLTKLFSTYEAQLKAEAAEAKAAEEEKKTSKKEASK